MTSLEQIRQQFPQYNKLSDHELASALYRKFYAGKIPEADYFAKLGLTVEDRSKYGAAETINNIVNQIGTGAYKGVAGMFALPRTLSDLTADRSPSPRHPVAGRAIPGADQYVQSTIQPGQTNPGQDYLPGYADILGVMQNQMGIPLAPAETTADKFLQAGGMGATAVALPGSAPANLVGGVTGSVASEGAGQLTEGTPYEPYARLLAGLVGGVAGTGGVNRAVASSMEDVLSRATTGYTTDEWLRAVELQSAAAKAGTPITSAEALAQVKGGNRQLMALQRYAEQSPASERQMADLLSKRAGGNQTATQAGLDRIAAAPDAPFEVGPTVQKAAQMAVNQTRQRINAVTDKLYGWSATDQIPPSEFADIADDPVFQHYLQKVRAEPLFQKDLKDLPDNAIAVVNQVKKAMDEDAGNFSTYGTGSTSPEKSMRLGEAQTPLVETARKSSPNYDAALDQQAEMRRTQLNPMERGITGQIADTSDWQAQAKLLMSDTPGSEKEVAQAIKNMLKADPVNAPTKVATLIRMKLEDISNKAAASVKGSQEEFRGANFASALEKNPQAFRSLEAAIKALPAGETKWAGFRTLLKVYEAQGQRLMPGSPTSFNQQMTEGLERGFFSDVKSLGKDLLDRWNLRRRTTELSRVLTDPNGVELLKQLALLGPNSARATQLVQAFFHTAQDRPGKEPTMTPALALPAR